ncbi:MAG: hypothetical protein WDW38_006483 [Sanguina aurantia]
MAAMAGARRRAWSCADPRLGLRGARERDARARRQTLAEINQQLAERAQEAGHELAWFQSNAEHELIGRIQQGRDDRTALILFNPAAFTHTSIALRRAAVGVARVQRCAPGRAFPPAACCADPCAATAAARDLSDIAHHRRRSAGRAISRGGCAARRRAARIARCARCACAAMRSRARRARPARCRAAAPPRPRADTDPSRPFQHAARDAGLAPWRRVRPPSRRTRGETDASAIRWICGGRNADRPPRRVQPGRAGNQGGRGSRPPVAHPQGARRSSCSSRTRARAAAPRAAAADRAAPLIASPPSSCRANARWSAVAHRLPGVRRHVLRLRHAGYASLRRRRRGRRRVAAGDELRCGIIEAIAMFKPRSTADVAGTVMAILVENGQPVEFGQPVDSRRKSRDRSPTADRLAATGAPCRPPGAALGTTDTHQITGPTWQPHGFHSGGAELHHRLLTMLEKVVIANRGIACRARARASGRCMAWASWSTFRRRPFHRGRAARLKHVVGRCRADRPVVVCIGPGPSTDSYLNIPRIIAAAEITDAAAIHPGYGFLAERADFAEQVEQSGFIFIGPTAAVIRLMGDKVEAIRAMKAAGVPCVPGSGGPLGDDVDENMRVARDIGYPVMIKAASGGGGRGMRGMHVRVHRPRARGNAARTQGRGRARPRRGNDRGFAV